MEYNCTNCSTTFTGSFCNSCGQKKYHRIDKKYIWDETQYMLLHTNKGFLYSVKSILRNPGKTAREFIDGKRVSHYKPMLLAFLLSGISAFISFKVVGLTEVLQDLYAQQHVNSALMNDYMAFVRSYNSFIMLALIPFFAFFTRLVFRKWGHNYYEHVVMNAYIISFYNLVTIFLVYPVLYLLKGNIKVFGLVTELVLFLIVPILIWFFKAFYADKPLKSIIGKVILTFLLVLLVLVILVFIAIVVLAVFMKHKHTH